MLLVPGGGRWAEPLERIVANSRNAHLRAVLGSGPPGTRTRNLRIKSPLLYPIELEARRGSTVPKTRSAPESRVTEGT
jgi:hypothetical protein